MTRGALKKVRDGLFLLPSSLDNSLLDSVLMNPASQKNAVKDVCRELKKIGFDLVVVDCSPSLNSAVISTVCAAHTLVIPVSSDILSFRGLELTLGEVMSICKSFGLKRPQIKILYTRHDRRERISNEALKRLSKLYQTYLIPAVIRTSTDYSKALEKRVSIFDAGGKTKAKEDYDRYARYILGIEAKASV
ncbi:MAG: ParA family protein, partial [Desulfobacterales bacterium]|nr:ParA family protein [Desulfobacterales bacterium]